MKCHSFVATLSIVVVNTLLSSVTSDDARPQSRIAETPGTAKRSFDDTEVVHGDWKKHSIYRREAPEDFHRENVRLESPYDIYSGGYHHRQGLDRDGADHEKDHGHHEHQGEASSSHYPDDYNYADTDGETGYGYAGYDDTDHDHESYSHRYRQETTTEPGSTTSTEPETTTTTEAPTTTTPAPEPKTDPYERVGSYIDGLAIFLIPWMVILCLGLLLPWIESLARRRSLSDDYVFQLDQFNDILTNSIEKFECLKWFKCQSENAIVRRTWGKPALRLLERVSPSSVASWASTVSQQAGEASCEQYKCSCFGTNF